MGTRYFRITLIFVLYIISSSFISRINNTLPKMVIEKNNIDITDAMDNNNQEYYVDKNNKIKFRLMNNSVIEYRIYASIEIVSKQFQQWRKQEKADRYEDKILVATEFSTSPEFFVPTHKFNRFISRIIVEIDSVNYKDNQGEISKLNEGIYYGLEYKFWRHR